MTSLSLLADRTVVLMYCVYHLHVHNADPAEITEFSIDKTVIKGDEPLNVHCKFEGNPDPNFIIMNNNARYQHVYIDATGSHVDITNQIANARCEDSGPWICTGRNSLNKRNVTRSGNVTVFCKYFCSIGSRIDWLQSLKQFFINVSYHILVASLTLMALF